jgi:hypothetical protein
MSVSLAALINEICAKSRLAGRSKRMDVVNPLSISIAEDNAAHRLLAAAEQLLAGRSRNTEAAFVGKPPGSTPRTWR